jgi:hypothetical protein
MLGLLDARLAGLPFRQLSHESRSFLLCDTSSARQSAASKTNSSAVRQVFTMMFRAVFMGYFSFRWFSVGWFSVLLLPIGFSYVQLLGQKKAPSVTGSENCSFAGVAWWTDGNARHEVAQGGRRSA